MAEKTSPMDREPETLQAGLEDPRASLADKMGTLEEGIKDAWHGATAATARAVEGVKAVTETTVHAVQGAAHSTSKAMGWAFDLPAHVRSRCKRDRNTRQSRGSDRSGVGEGLAETAPAVLDAGLKRALCTLKSDSFCCASVSVRNLLPPLGFSS